MGDSTVYLNHYLLNEVASFIWDHCDGQTSAWEIAADLAKECVDSAPPFDRVLRDVLETMEDLRKKRVLAWRDKEPCDVLLVSPPFPSIYDQDALHAPEFLSPPMGLAYLASYLRENGFSVSIRDLHVEGLGPESIVSTCRTLTPKVVGLTATTPTYPNALHTARFIKAWNPKATIILGGVHATGMPRECLADGPFDYVVLGEGEATFLELCKSLINGSKAKVENVPGMAFREPEKGMVITAPPGGDTGFGHAPFSGPGLAFLRPLCKERGAVHIAGMPE